MSEKGKLINAAETKPWLKFYSSDVPQTIDYPQVSLYEALVKSAEKYPNEICWDFMGTTGSPPAAGTIPVRLGPRHIGGRLQPCIYSEQSHHGGG